MYMQLAEIPVPALAQFTGDNTFEISYTIRDHVRNTKRSMAKSFAITEPSIIASSFYDVGEIVASTISPSLQLRANLREIKTADGVKRYVEIWIKDRLEISKDVTDQHGAFYADEYLSSLAFSPTESQILYSAEGKIPDTEDPYARFRYTPDFGEGLVGKKRPTIFIFSWDESSNTLKSVATPAGVLCGQAIFSPNNQNIIYATGYEYSTDGRLLGVKGCHNRPTGVWQLRLSSNSGDDVLQLGCTAKKLTSETLSCRSPRIFTADGKSTLIFFSSQSGGAHVATSSLHSLDITNDETALNPNEEVRTIVDIIQRPGPGGFPGLYPPYNISSSPILRKLKGPSDAKILINSVWGSRSTVLITSFSGTPEELTPDTGKELYSWSLLATDGHKRVVCQRSNSNTPYEIVFGEYEEGAGITWKVIDRPNLPTAIEEALSTLETSITPIPGHHPTETIVIRKRAIANEIPPLITSPHGGPHGTTTTAFSPATIALVLEGYTISLPNYTGSPGYGEESINALIGKCGRLDVADCIASVNHLVNLGIAQHGEGRQFVMGGSHGGFLTAHLIGQYPDVFSAAVMRNPVISVGEISTSDIPDWYFAEFGLQYPIISSPVGAERSDQNKLPRVPLMTKEAFAQLQASSPIAYVDNVRVPVLLLIGAADRRVAPTQGIDYFHALKRRREDSSCINPKVEMLIFEGESHPLEGVEAGKVGWEAGRDWLAAARKQ